MAVNDIQCLQVYTSGGSGIRLQSQLPVCVAVVGRNMNTIPIAALRIWHILQ